MLKYYKNEVENQLNNKIKKIKSDKDGEQKSHFDKFCF